MVFAHADADSLIPLKVLIAGGFGLAATARAISETTSASAPSATFASVST